MFSSVRRCDSKSSLTSSRLQKQWNGFHLFHLLMTDICLKQWKQVMNTFRFYSTVISSAWMLDFQEKEIKCVCGRLTHLLKTHLFCSSALFMSTFAESDSLSSEKDTNTHLPESSRAAPSCWWIHHFDSHILTPTLSFLSKCYRTETKALTSRQMRGRENDCSCRVHTLCDVISKTLFKVYTWLCRRKLLSSAVCCLLSAFISPAALTSHFSASSQSCCPFHTNVQSDQTVRVQQ